MDFRQTNFNSLIIILLSLFVLFLFAYLIYPFVFVIFWAGILAFYLYPLYQKTFFIKKNKKTLSALFTLALFILFVLLPFIFLSILFFNQIQNLLQNLDETLLQKVLNYLTIVKEKLSHSKLYPYIDPYLQQIQQDLPQKISILLENVIKYTSGAIFSTFSFFLKIVFTLFTLYYFLVDGEKIVNLIKELIPGDSGEKERILARVSLILKGVLYGNILTALVQGFLALIIYFILGVPQYLFFSFLTMIASFLPFLGTALIWIPLSVYFFLSGSVLKGTILIILCALTVAQVDNLIKPFLIGEKTKLHNLLVFFSVLGGISQFGLTGLFLGPVILGFFLSVIDIYKAKVLNHLQNDVD
ncbi:MAG: AI-2E family transporter [Caldimicrobium sp.]